MRVIGVLDLRAGRAVHARGGRRDEYAPVAAAAGVALVAGDPLALARVYVDQLGVRELYAADLDAILGGPVQREAITALAALNAPLWLDAGVASVPAARAARALGASRVVVGLETLESFDALARVCDAMGGDCVALSVDLRAGALLARAGVVGAHETPEQVAARAAAAGVGSVIVLDLARVGAGAGLDLALLGRVRAAAPGIALLAGGGVRDAGDLSALAAAGCRAALVGTALHTGQLGAREIEAAEQEGG